jgi:hypothetical protein
METAQKEKIKALIEKGRWNYVLKAVLFFGLPGSIIMYLITEGPVFDLEMVLVWLVVGVLMGGFGFGLTMWWYLNRQYKQG